VQMMERPKGGTDRRNPAGPALTPREVHVLRKHFSCRASRVLHDEEGQDLVEYALLVAFIALASVAALSTLSDDIAALWTAIAARLASTS
jgi:pilus assembly protein Flp/PilA